MKKLILLSLILILSAKACFAFIFSNPIEINFENSIYHITIKDKKAYKKLKFISSEKLMSNEEAHIKSGALLTVNAGYFDPKNQKTISYIVYDRNTAADPLFNENLLKNAILRQNIDKIINRSEFRIVDCDGKWHYEIAPHKTALDFACTIETSAQGGPMILPDLKLEEEFFILKKGDKIIRESAHVLHKTARTVIALKGQEVHILVITNENPMDIYEVRDLCIKKGFDYAMALDGGSSTSLNYKDKLKVTSTKDPAGRMLKSFLIYKK